MLNPVYVPIFYAIFGNLHKPRIQFKVWYFQWQTFMRTYKPIPKQFDSSNGVIRNERGEIAPLDTLPEKLGGKNCWNCLCSAAEITPATNIQRLSGLETYFVLGAVKYQSEAFKHNKSIYSFTTTASAWTIMVLVLRHNFDDESVHTQFDYLRSFLHEKMAGPMTAIQVCPIGFTGLVINCRSMIPLSTR